MLSEEEIERNSEQSSAKLWKEFCKFKKIPEDTPYDYWMFGDGESADELLSLVLQGKKFGTASLYEWYEIDEEELPKPGDYSVITDSKGDAVCVIRDYDVTVTEFGKVSEFHGFSEGEEERNLQAWRRIHEEFFNEELEELEKTLSETDKVVCEKFSLEYVKGNSEEIGEFVFMEPNMAYADQIAAYRKELLEIDSDFSGCLSLKRMEDPEEWVNYCLGWSDPSRELKEQGIRGTLLMCIRKEDNKLVGMTQVHQVLNDFLTNYAGHIGYNVRPDERGKGYAKMILRKALEFEKCIGNNPVIVSCEPQNLASKKTILACGGVYEKTVVIPDENVTLERYEFRF